MTRKKQIESAIAILKKFMRDNPDVVKLFNEEAIHDILFPPSEDTLLHRKHIRAVYSYYFRREE